MHSGLIEVWSEEPVELRIVTGRGSIIGERSALKDEEGQLAGINRMNNTYAQSNVELLHIDGNFFKHVAAHLNLKEGFRKAEWLLLHSPFQEMLWADILDLALDLRIRQLSGADVLYEAQTPGHESFILVSGEVNLYDAKGELCYELREQGKFFGGRATLFNELHRFKAVAQTDAEVWVLHAVDLKRLHMVHPSISLQLRGDEMTTV